MMEQYQLNTICDRALLLDYKAELFVLRKDFDNALKKRMGTGKTDISPI